MSLELIEQFEKDTAGSSAPWKEIVIEKGGVRQAGAPEYLYGGFPKWLRKTSQRSLYFFGKAIVGRKYFSSNLHLPAMNWLQCRIPFRKLLLWPRDHAKTSMVSHCLPPHILIQDKEDNCYFPGLDGSEQRIMLACETEGRAGKHVRVVETMYEANRLFRALFPDKIWQGNPKQASKKWNELEMIIPRANEYPEASLFGVGVGGAITGARPTVMIKDDLVTLAARNSEMVMRTAVEWHVASRALLDEYEESTGLQALEFIIGTRWAIWDLYEFIISGDPLGEFSTEPDPTVETVVRSIVEDGVAIWPERFTLEKVAQLKREMKSLFPLLYMNDANNPELVSFDISMLRYFRVEGDEVIFTEGSEDLVLADKWKEQPVVLPEGATLTPQLMHEYLSRGRAEYLRLKRI